MAERRRRKELHRSPRFYGACVAAGLLIGASCPLWPENARPFCTSLSLQLKQLGLGWFGIVSPSPSSAPDAGS